MFRWASVVLICAVLVGNAPAKYPANPQPNGLEKLGSFLIKYATKLTEKQASDSSVIDAVRTSNKANLNKAFPKQISSVAIDSIKDNFSFLKLEEIRVSLQSESDTPIQEPIVTYKSQKNADNTVTLVPSVIMPTPDPKPKEKKIKFNLKLKPILGPPPDINLKIEEESGLYEFNVLMFLRDNPEHKLKLPISERFSLEAISSKTSKSLAIPIKLRYGKTLTPTFNLLNKQTSFTLKKNHGYEYTGTIDLEPTTNKIQTINFAYSHNF
jgi:hypothetical protein